MKVFKRLFAIAGLTTLTLPVVEGLMGKSPTWAQDDACYMVTSSGQRVSLGKLCQRTPVQPATATPQGVFRVRIKRRDGGTPVIDVKFNGNQTYEMLVDTGATGTLVTQRMAQSLNLPIVGAGRFTMADGRTITMPVGLLNSLSVSGATIRNVNVAIAGDYAEGLLGSDFLGNYDVKIKRDVIEFYPR
jgi:aspartyl protease family protein